MGTGPASVVFRLPIRSVKRTQTAASLASAGRTTVRRFVNLQAHPLVQPDRTDQLVWREAGARMAGSAEVIRNLRRLEGLEGEAPEEAGKAAANLTARRRWMAAGVCIAGLFASMGVWRALLAREAQLIQSQFALEAEERVGSIGQEFTENFGTLHALTAFYEGSQSVEPDEFAVFSKSLLRRHPSVRALGWAPLVSAAQRPDYEQTGEQERRRSHRIRRRGPNGQLIPAAQREECFPVDYLEPPEGHVLQRGLDLGSAPTLLGAIQRARETGRLAAAPVIDAEVDNDGVAYVLVCAPVYRRDAPADTPEQRREALEGLYVGLFAVDAIVEHARGDMPVVGIDLCLFDSSLPTADKLVYGVASRGRRSPFIPMPRPPEAASVSTEYVADLEVADRRWVAHCVPTDVYLARWRTGTAAGAFGAGLLMTALLTAYLVSLGKQATRVESLVGRRTGELRESEQRFRSMVETISDWIWAVDQYGTYTYSSPKVRDLLGYEPDEMAGKTLYEFVLPSELEAFRAAIRRSMMSATPLVRLEHTRLHKDGRYVILETNAMPVLDAKGRLRGYRGVDRDVTEVKEAQDSLRERERRYSELLAAVTNYTYSVRVEDGVAVSITHGEGCLAVTGYDAGDYASDPELWLSIVHPQDRETVRRHRSQILAGEDVPPLEHRILRRDGTTRWVRDTVVAHCDNGTLVGYDGLIEDITERRKAESALRNHELQLATAQKIQERLLPQDAPRLPGFDVAGLLCPAEFAAGDYFDYLRMRDGTLGLAIGDVSGHGFAPSLIMACTHVLLRSLAEARSDLGEILTLANSVLIRETDEYRFVTLMFACLDPRSRSLAYVNAGHPTGYVLDASGNIRARMNSTHLPLGILPGVNYSATGPIALEPGDTVLLLTDGFAESRSSDGTVFGTERVLEFVRANLHTGARQIADALCQAVREFSQRKTLRDDMTVIVVKVGPAD